MRLALFLSAFLLVSPRICDAVPATHPGDVLLLTRNGHVYLFHPESGSYENFANLSPFHVTTGMVREASGDFLICDESAGAVARLHAGTGSVTIVTLGNELAAPVDLDLSSDGFIYAVD